MDHRELLGQVRRRPSMYFGRGDLDFERLVAFVVGLDLGARGGLLDGFREYLLLLLDEQSSLWWPGLTLKVTVPPGPSLQALTVDEDRAAVDGLFRLLDEFLAEFPEGTSRQRMHHEYFLWKQRLSFFDLNLERYRSAPPPEMISVEDAAAVLGVTRADLFDLIAVRRLAVFRAGAMLLVSTSRIAELRRDAVEAESPGGHRSP